MAFLLRNSLHLIKCQYLLQASKGNFWQHLESPLSTSALSQWQKHQTHHAASGGDAEGKANTTKKPKDSSVKITLIQNDNMSVTGLEEARNLAKRRSMHLVQVQKMDSKTQRPVYKLITAAEHLQEELSDFTAKSDKSSDKNLHKHTVKNLNIGSRISDHDLASRIKNISKWLTKRNEIRILIQGNEKDMASCEKIFKTIEESLKSPDVQGKVVQKRIKGSIIKFNIIPIITSTDEKSSSNTTPTQ